MNISTPQMHHIPKLRSLWQEAFGDTEAFLDSFFHTAFSAKRCRCITVNDTAAVNAITANDEQIAAALYWFDCEYMEQRLAYVYAVATASSYRGQGFCHKLMENTHQHLSELGYAGTVLVPGNDSLFHFYEELGYQTCCYLKQFSCVRSADSAALRRIDKDEYARLRHQLLPRGGILQEKENLEFLCTQVKFYAGSDFLLAARKEKDMLYGVELLGKEAAAPGIVSALDCSRGSFRMPGADLPFAMYRPLKNSRPLPSYFGLAFD